MRLLRRLDHFLFEGAFQLPAEWDREVRQATFAFTDAAAMLSATLCIYTRKSEDEIATLMHAELERMLESALPNRPPR